MKLGSLKSGRDGQLVVVSRDLNRYVLATDIAPSLRAALEEWQRTAPLLAERAQQLEAGACSNTEALDCTRLAAPLPRTWEFVDGSAYLPHVARVRKARGAEVPDSFYTDPLMYQATAAGFLGPRDPVPLSDEAHGMDFEAEVVVVTGDLPMGASLEQAARGILLLGLVNDVSLRNLVPAELAKGFGFLQSKPRSALAPVLVTPDELGAAWRDTKVHLPLHSWLNGEWFGSPEAGEDMQFNFAQLVAHAARTRPLAAGTLVGSGTIANEDTARGASCLAEKRTLEVIATGTAHTPFMHYGDRIRICMFDRKGADIFGAIDQQIVRQEPGHES